MHDTTAIGIWARSFLSTWTARSFWCCNIGQSPRTNQSKLKITPEPNGQGTSRHQNYTMKQDGSKWHILQTDMNIMNSAGNFSDITLQYTAQVSVAQGTRFHQVPYSCCGPKCFDQQRPWHRQFSCEKCNWAIRVLVVFSSLGLATRNNFQSTTWACYMWKALNRHKLSFSPSPETMWVLILNWRDNHG